MGSGLRWICFLFILFSTGIELTSLLSNYMIENTLSEFFHDGIFWRCGAIQYLGVSRNHLKSLYGQEQIHVYAHIPISQQYLDSHILSGSRPKQDKHWFRQIPGTCYWWDRHTFITDEKALQVVVILSFISCGVVFLIYVVLSASLLKRFKTQITDHILASLLILNVLILIGIIIAYTIFIKGHTRMTDDQLPVSEILFTINLLPLYFGWSYWILYGSAAGNLSAALILFFFSKPAKQNYDAVYSGYLK